MTAAGVAKVGKPLKHPAFNLYLITMVLLVITVLLGFISVFVPWAMKDIGVAQRAWAYPFKTCIENTFSKVNEETCMDNDFIEPTGVPLTGGNAKCKGFILATIAFVFISVILGVVMIVLLAFLLFHLWSRPLVVGGIFEIGMVIVCVTAFLAWIMFICYAQTECAPNSIFPIAAYSYGFVLYIFGSTAALLAVITSIMAISKLKSFQPLADAASDEEQMVYNREMMYNPAPADPNAYGGVSYPLYAGESTPFTGPHATPLNAQSFNQPIAQPPIQPPPVPQQFW